MDCIWILISLLCFIIMSSSGREVSFQNLYDMKPRPSQLGEPTRVDVALVVHSIEIDDNRQVLGVSCELLQKWRDTTTPNLQDDIILHAAHNEKLVEELLWVPDITVSNGLPLTQSQATNFFRIGGSKSNDFITWTQKLYIEIPCEMDFESFPFDRHRCKLKLQSASYFEDELIASWPDKYKVDLGEDLHITPRYTLEDIYTSWATVSGTPNVKRELIAEFRFDRISGWTIKHTIMPFVGAVTTAYLAFFINVGDICARAVICGIAMIMASIFYESTYNTAPRNRYTMGLEIYTGICLTFIWIAMVETVVVDVLAHLRRQSVDLDNDRQVLAEEHSKASLFSRWVDRVFKFLYPIAFIAFNAIYWSIYTRRYDYYNEYFESETIYNDRT